MSTSGTWYCVYCGALQPGVHLSGCRTNDCFPTPPPIKPDERIARALERIADALERSSGTAGSMEKKP